jgi:CBS domain containing-hemolysin-like protein
MSDSSPRGFSGVTPWLKRLFRLGATDRNSAGINSKSTSTSQTIDADALERLRVEDVMVPRADIVGVEVSTPLGELAEVFAKAAHSRLPVYRETLDDPVGIVHIKDLIAQLAPGENGTRPAGWAEQPILSEISRPLLFAPPSMRAADLLRRMQARRMHLALVVDEYGGTDGLVTLEDLIEPIVGDIEDEHDDEDTVTIRSRGGGVWDVEARATIDDFEIAAGEEIASADEDDEVDSLGGLVFTIAGRIPERGEVIRHPSGYEFEVVEADPRRIKRMRVRAPKPAKSATSQPERTPAP